MAGVILIPLAFIIVGNRIVSISTVGISVPTHPINRVPPPTKCSLFTQFALAAVRVKGCWLGAKYRSLCGRMPRRKALTAIAHKLAIIVYHILKNKVVYKDCGKEYVNSATKSRQIRRAIALLESHGMKVLKADSKNFAQKSETLE